MPIGLKVLISWTMQVSIIAACWDPQSCQLRIHYFVFFFSLSNFKTYFLFFQSSDLHFCHTCTLILPSSSSQQHIPICLFLMSPSFATQPTFVISSIVSKPALVVLTELFWNQWLCALSSTTIVHPTLIQILFILFIYQATILILIPLPGSC